MMIKGYIFQQDLLKRYMSEFNIYAVKSIYGDIIMGSDIEEQYKNIPPEDGE